MLQESTPGTCQPGSENCQRGNQGSDSPQGGESHRLPHVEGGGATHQDAHWESTPREGESMGVRAGLRQGGACSCRHRPA
eukprot:3730661-Prymnesium_polylepis.1